MAEAFSNPEFLENCSPDDFHAYMREILPADIDMSEGGHAWNLTRPSALIAAQICEFILPEVIRLISPEWSYGEFLDGHAKARNIIRKEATAASGILTITGDPGVEIPAGSLFSTAAVNEEPSVDYETLEDATIPDSGSVNVAIQCTQTGEVGNTAVNTIVLVASRNTGITAVTNKEAVTGGTEEESDTSLQERILEYDQGQGSSFVGSVSDYKRWATSVDGVGEATIIPAQDDSGLVRIILSDANGSPATENLCEEVYNYIMRPDSPEERLAPVNAYLRVEAPSTIAISIKVTVELEEGATLEAVKAAYKAKLADYLLVALDDGEIKYTRVAAALAATEGANDFSGLQVGIKDGATVTYGTANIAINETQLPVIAEEDLILTEGTV